MALSVLPADAAQSGLTYQTFASWGGSPPLPESSEEPLSSGAVNAINFDWGGGPVLDSGRYDGVIVRFDGWLSPPTNEIYSLCGLVDDGFRLILDGQLVIDDWWDKGPSCGNVADVDFSDGQAKQLTAWMYENGGGAVAVLLFHANDGSWLPIPDSWYTASPILTTTTTVEATTTTVETTTTTLLEETTTTVEDTTTFVPSTSTSSIPDATTPPETTDVPQPPVVIPPTTEAEWQTTIPETTTPETTTPETTDSETTVEDATTSPTTESTDPPTTDSVSTEPTESVSTVGPSPTEVPIPTDPGTTEPPSETTGTDEEAVAPPNDAPEQVKRAFEAQVNVFDGTHDDYVPAGSTVTVAQRRSLIAATVTMSNLIPTSPSRRKR